jgi:hypothetical protein
MKIWVLVAFRKLCCDYTSDFQENQQKLVSFFIEAITNKFLNISGALKLETLKAVSSPS